MPLRLHEEQTSGFALRPAERITPEYNANDVLGAAFGLENDVRAAFEWMTRPEFEKDDAFDPLTVTKSSPYWDNYKDKFVGAVSQDHWDYIASKIERENKQREILDSAGLAGVGAMLLAGIASPTMLLPATTPYRGFKGITAAASLGGLAAGLQEVPLHANQVTRTYEESVFALGAGTFLGGIVGGAAQLIPPAGTKEIGQVYGDVRRAFENDMARARGAEAIPEPREPLAPLRETEGQIIRRLDDGAFDTVPVRPRVAETVRLTPGASVSARSTDTTAFERIAVDETVGESVRFENVLVADNLRGVKESLGVPQNTPAARVVEAARAQGYDGIRYSTADSQPAIIRVPDPQPVVVQEGPLVRTPSANPGANASPFAEVETAAAGAQVTPGLSDAGVIQNAAAIRNISPFYPVAQTAGQNEFPLMRKIMANITTGGYRFEGNAQGVASSLGGTVETRAALYDTYIAKLVKTMDEHYTDYFYNGETRPAFPATRAAIRSAFKFTGDKLTRDQFNTEVSRAFFDGEHPIKQVKAAADILQSEIYSPILREADRVELFGKIEDLMGDAAYLPRQWSKRRIDSDPTGLVNILTKHYEKLLQDDVAKATDRLKEQKRVLDDYIEDVGRSAEDVTASREAWQARLDELGETDEETQIKALRREARGIQKAVKEGQTTTVVDTQKAAVIEKELAGFPADLTKLTPAESRRYNELLNQRRELSTPAQRRLDEIRGEVATLQERIRPQLDEKADINRRLRNLNKSFSIVEDRRQRKLARVDKTESDALIALTSVLRKGMQLQRDIDKFSEPVFRKQRDLLVERYYALRDVMDRRQKRLDEAGPEVLGRPVEDKDGLWVLYREQEQAKIDASLARMAELDARIDELIDLDLNRDVLAEIAGDLAVEASAAVNELNLARGARIARLQEAAAKLSPEQVAEALAKRRAKFASREEAARERFRQLGVVDFDFETGNAAVSAVAKERAIETVQKIQSLGGRIAGLHLVGEERGSELARVLSIPSNEVFDYLETDIERVTRNYLRQVAADIELKRTFGDVDAKAYLSDAEKEYYRVIEDMQAKGATEAEVAAASRRFRQHEKNIEASIMRLRHTWGVPDDPDSFAARGAKLMLDLNTLRFMGSVAVSSIPDLGRLVMKDGITRTMRDSFLPLIRDMKTWKMSARELRLAGGGLDPLIHSRAMGFADIMDEYVGNTIPERVVHTMATKMGVLAGFDYWTSFIKQMAVVQTNARLMDSIDLVVNGGGKAAEVREATTYLAELGIDASTARGIWDEVANGGGGKVNGVWLPNTEDWADPDGSLRRAYRAALRRAVDDRIITPGLELPLAVNRTPAMRMLFQFKSFSLSSHAKTLGAGLQQRDAAIVNGMASSLALGMLSYYIWAATIGGDAYQEMLDAPFERWVDEGIARAGFMGAFAEAQRIAERVPALAPYANLSGERTTRRAGSDLTEALLGPSFASLGDITQVIAGIDDPTQSTVRQAAKLLPYQNIFYIRALFELLDFSPVEDLASNFPERRETK